ncbi:MAG: hypothetical protein AAGC93_10780 [Cyanobacteria bacterium P01_F01_bin.53]
MAIAYWTFAGITLTLTVNAFLKDQEAIKHDNKAFLFIALTTLLWPITLPFIVNKKLQRAKAMKAIKLSKQRRKLQVVHSPTAEVPTVLSTTFHHSPATSDS